MAAAAKAPIVAVSIIAILVFLVAADQHSPFSEGQRTVAGEG